MLEGLLIFMLAGEAAVTDRVEVRGRDIAPDGEQATARLSAAELESIRPTHPSEVMTRLPGSWVTRGSGQEHLSAVRSPLLAGAGGCGALLILEEGIPIRPPGFCNVNNLFEVNMHQAVDVSVLRGPGGLGHASGGLHGVIDVRTRSPLTEPLNAVRLEGGSDDYLRGELRLTGDLGDGALALDATMVDAGSFREDEGYDHRLLTLHHAVPTERGQWETVLSAAQLDQDTAGFVQGERAYADPELRQANFNPEAFRTGSAARLVSRAQWVDESGAENRLTGFARRSRMTFLQHFLPGQPLERNGQVSAGLQFDQEREVALGALQWGVDAEWFNGFLFQAQDGEADAPPPMAGIRPPGRHYDYEVDGQRLGGYMALGHEPAPDWRIRAGVHADWVRYDYDNLMAEGNLAEDGTTCEFGGCLYNRPADRSDDYLEVAPELTISRDFDEGMAWLRLARGFRAPQATELYRLQRGQDVADLDAEALDAVELGVRGSSPLEWELVGFYQRKRNFIFRDAEGFNVSDGRTGHRGVEFSLRHQLSDTLAVAARGSYAIHWYRFDRDLGGELIQRGRDVSSAPRRLASTDLTWRPDDDWLAQLAVEHNGGYWLDAENTRRYGGHTLWHAFLQRDLAAEWTASLRLRNLTNRRYAERADFAFGNFRYFPGPGRSLFASLEKRW
ncbi:TonB-dependent receptor [Wenzhouxiangella sp. AB-CW3]|uniref:TonB-dependent receptor n=1 Tax=Wenzhouxiangella sp. AB-CW3 TaxID=2771012 RepID=UPI00168A908C|nr:TonB-dependent receptor [Wenzhouxiangella sp. AB-CW3]QOC23285.1 TonB-dependent receptor [Wenzhouxiangella sp. AB-CW3]